LFVLRSNGYNIISTQDNLVELVEGTEKGRYTVDHLLNWFKRNAVPV
jgi:prophage maintenance system killer protein